jgi:hypothetical protein
MPFPYRSVAPLVRSKNKRAQVLVASGVNAPLLFHLFNPPSISGKPGTQLQMAQRYDLTVYNNTDHAWVNGLYSAGWPVATRSRPKPPSGLAYQYIFTHVTQLGGAAVPNNIGGIFPAGIPTFVESDYLHNGAGARLYEVAYNGVFLYFMNLSSTTFRNWYFARIVNLIDATYGNPPCVFLDNTHMNLYQMWANNGNGNGSIQEYSNSHATMRTAVLDFLTAMVTYVKAARPAARIVGNLISWGEGETEMQPFVASGRLDGGMYEYTYVKYSDLLWSAALWTQQLRMVDWFTTNQRIFLAICPQLSSESYTSTNNLARFRFCYASYLLNFSEYVYFYFSGHPYQDTTQYAEYSYNLGKPTSTRYQPDAAGSPYLWKRDFEHGSVQANGSTATGTITYTG